MIKKAFSCLKISFSLDKKNLLFPSIILTMFAAYTLISSYTYSAKVKTFHSIKCSAELSYSNFLPFFKAIYFIVSTVQQNSCYLVGTSFLF